MWLEQGVGSAKIVILFIIYEPHECSHDQCACSVLKSRRLKFDRSDQPTRDLVWYSLVRRMRRIEARSKTYTQSSLATSGMQAFRKMHEERRCSAGLKVADA